jgi:hypothetical protein
MGNSDQRERLRMEVRSALLALSTFVGACAPTDHGAVLRELRSQLAVQFHECVPLGWNVVPHHGLAIPGTSVEVNEYGDGRVWLPAMWLAQIRPGSMRRADVRATARLLDALTRAGLLRRESGPRGVFYHLTDTALPYYFAENTRGNNPDQLSYLCYSRIVPDRVMWTERVRVKTSASREERAFNAKFAWHGATIASWALDPFIRSHGVVLAPTRSPAIAKFVQHGQTWFVSALYCEDSPLPLVVNASAWSAASRS